MSWASASWTDFLLSARGTTVLPFVTWAESARESLESSWSIMATLDEVAVKCWLEPDAVESPIAIPVIEMMTR